MPKTKYEFDFVEEEGQDDLQWIKDVVRDHNGYILVYEKVGPGGGNPRYIVEVTFVDDFEQWLNKMGIDPIVARVL